ncbi:unnamed protein product [Paramecium sonneborni]|uniref:Uncharacterized protein n=1 Tax=Paramecium sonneborni TaxID=65129 RepID=A0A8S1RN80_9CILI|nr:unnamed protein product [Paramecium sonneborni]
MQFIILLIFLKVIFMDFNEILLKMLQVIIYRNSRRNQLWNSMKQLLIDINRKQIEGQRRIRDKQKSQNISRKFGLLFS